MKRIRMKKITLMIIAIAGVCSTLFAQDQMVLDEHAQLRTINATFNRVEIAQNVKLVLNQSDQIALAVSASDEKYISDIKTEVANNILKISRVGSQSPSNKNRRYTVYLSFRDIRMLQASGAAEILVVGAVRLQHLSIELTGASELKGTFRVDSLYMNLSGASEAKMNGKVELLDMRCSGASDFAGYNLLVENCTIEVSGASDVYVTVNKTLLANASGASKIYYKGPVSTIDIKKGGVSEIKRTD